jgi:anthranilate synthase component II
MKIMVLDNYDSFTFNLVHALEKISGTHVDVFRNNAVPLETIKAYDKIVLSPGPGIPDEAGILKSLIAAYAPSKSIFGVCLGMQAIGEVFGGTLINLSTVFHGVATRVHVVDKTEVLFKDMPEHFDAGRYHSWIVNRKNLPGCLRITVEDEQGEIMGLSHTTCDVKGVQFHPESILTPLGEKIIAAWLNS